MKYDEIWWNTNLEVIDDEELKDDMEHTLKKSQKIREIEEELLKELNK